MTRKFLFRLASSPARARPTHPEETPSCLFLPGPALSPKSEPGSGGAPYPIVSSQARDSRGHMTLPQGIYTPAKEAGHTHRVTGDDHSSLHLLENSRSLLRYGQI